jgi:hypothetical protein
MAKIVITRRVGLEFLGEEYKDSYLDFRAIPIKDFKEIVENAKQTEQDALTSIDVLLKTLKKYFVEGKFLGEVVNPEDLDQLDQNTAVQCFEVLTGQQLDPKA